MGTLTSEAGSPIPLGASYYGHGVNFAVFSRNATEVTIEFYEKQEDTVPCSKFVFNPEAWSFWSI